jgi:hypothetical protein
MTAIIPRSYYPPRLPENTASRPRHFYTNNPEMNNYLAVKWQPIVKPEPKKEQTSTFQPVEIRLTLDAAKSARCIS